MRRERFLLSVELGLLAVLLACCSAGANQCFASRAKSCSDCLQTGMACAYCTDETFNGPRCDFYTNIAAHGCSAASIIRAESSDKTEKNVNINTKVQQAQVSPQEVSMTFLPGEEKTMDVSVFSPTKGPLDLYILMDFSNSMEDDLDNLKNMGNNLASLVKTMSDDYTIGFGKFVDKVIEPQTDMRPSKLAQPSANSDPPFSFQNVIKLTKDVEFFISVLKKERISGNLDSPEGGFDAILQATVCEKNIGWRQHSTHLLVFSTGSAFHYENDGANVLAGVLPRNDELCHLDAEGNYRAATKQDYPSIPTLVRLMGKHDIIPIFAVTSHSYEFYEKLKEYFPIAEVGLLEEDSSNILQVMEKAFENIRSKMSIRAEDRPKAFKAQFLTTSGQVAQYGAFNFKPGEIGNLRMKLKAQQMIDEELVCKMNPEERNGTIRVKPTTFSTAVNVKASVLCPTCDCEKTRKMKADRCHGNGDLVCGRCQCNQGWLGMFCNCSASDSALDTSQCIRPGATEPCSGRGDCLACGTCVCYKPDQFEGAFCEHDKTQCQRYAGFLCNDRGSCVMGKCDCTDGWKGDACECSTSNQTCLDSKGTLCGRRGKCVCGRCECPDTDFELSANCEPNFQFQLGVCEATRSCVQCQAWKTGEKKSKKECDKCPFKVIMVDELKERKEVLDSCSFRDEDDNCMYYYTAEDNKDHTESKLVVQVLKKKDCPDMGFLRLLPLLLFLLLLLALLLLCCWKYCACCRSCWQSCLALLPCCRTGRMVGFKEDEYFLRQSLLTSNHLDTPMVRTGPPKGTDVVRWKVTDNVHRGINHPQAQIKPNPQEMIQFPLSLRLNRSFSENLSRPKSRDSKQLRMEVADNLNEVYKQIPGAQMVQQTSFRMQKNAGKRQDYTIMDTVLPAPRSTYLDIVKLTEKNVQSGNFNSLKVVPGYYTVATDREAAGAVEFQEDVESVDVHVPLFVKDEDDDKKQLQVEAVGVPLGIAGIRKRYVNITIIKEHATSIFSFLQPNYMCSRQDGLANIPISREIIKDGHTQVTYRTRDLSAKDKKDYVNVEGDLSYGPGETQKLVPVRLLELSEKDSLLEDKQVKQFVMDLSNPRHGAKLGRYPRTTVTITDLPEPSVMMFEKKSQNVRVSDPTYSIPVVCTPNHDGPATVKWRTKDAQHFNLSWALIFGPGETRKNIVIDPKAHPGLNQLENFHLELFEPSANAVIGERKMIHVNVTDREPSVMMFEKKSQNVSASDPTYSIPVVCTQNHDGPATVKWRTKEAQHFYLSGLLIFGPGETSKNIVIDPKAHPGLNQLENFHLELFEPSANAVIGERKMIHVNVKEREPSLMMFEKKSQNVSASDPTYSIPVVCTQNHDGPATVKWRTKEAQHFNLSWALIFGPGETRKNIVIDPKAHPGLNQLENFHLELFEPSANAVIGERKMIHVNVTDRGKEAKFHHNIQAFSEPSVMMFEKKSQNVSASDPTYCIPVVCTQNHDSPATVKWRTKEAQHFYLSGLLIFGPGETSKNIVIDPKAHPGLNQLENFHLELFEPSANAVIGDRKMIHVNVTEGVLKSPAQLPQKSYLNQNALSPGGLPLFPDNVTVKATGPRNIHLNWDPPAGNPTGYKVKYWIYGDPEKDAQVLNVKTPHAELTDLYPYCDYEMRVCAYNAMGESSYTDMVSCQTLEDVPGEPGRLAFNVISPTVTQLSWAEPAETNGDITAYEVIYTPIDDKQKPVGAAKIVKIDNPKKRMLLIENLQSAQTYQYKVRAKNSVGWGPVRNATINLASQPSRPMSIPIIPDFPIVDPKAGDEYDSYLMYSNDVLKSPTSSKTPSVSGDDYMMNGKWEQIFLFPGGSSTRNLSASSSPLSTVSSNYRGAGGSFTTETHTAYMSGAGSTHRQDVIGGGVHTSEVIMRKHSENRGYTNENNQDSTVMGDVSTKFPDLNYMMNGMWEQNFLFPGGSSTRNLSASSSPLSTLSSNYRGAGGSFTTETHTAYMSGAGSTHRQDVIGGGVHTSEVIMRKRSENRGYTDENIRDSIVMGDVSTNFPGLRGFDYSGLQSLPQSQFSSSLSQGSRARTPSSGVSEALYSLDRVLQDARLSPGVPDTPSRLVFSALGPTALKVSWQEPNCEKDILGYCVLYQLLNGGETKRINVTNPAENSVIIHDLLPNHSYLFKVKAQSQEGWGPEREGVITIESAVDPKSPLSPVPGSPFTLSTPSAPGTLLFTALSPDSLQLSWEKPHKPNGDILGYVVTCEQLHSGGDVRTFQVNGDSPETSLTVPNLTENVPYKFKVQARTTQGFGPEREGIITIESQDGAPLSQYNSQSVMRREVLHMPTEVTTRTNVSHSVLNDPYFSDGMMMTTHHTESSGMMSRQITREVVQRSVTGGSTVTKRMFYES